MDFATGRMSAVPASLCLGGVPDLRSCDIPHGLVLIFLAGVVSPCDNFLEENILIVARTIPKKTVYNRLDLKAPTRSIAFRFYHFFSNIAD